MGISLDELLNKTGLRKLAGEDQPANEDPFDFSKLAERCRRAADASPDERATVAAGHLVEKTAAVEIIRRTLSEIRAIEGEPTVKTAGAVDHAVFIKTALEEGHSPEAIARFLEQPPPKTKTKTSTPIVSP
jgi:hypothetical protein